VNIFHWQTATGSMPRYSVITQCMVCYTVVPRTVSKHVILPIKSISVCKQLFHMSSFSLWLRWNPFLWDWIPIITEKQTGSGHFCYFKARKNVIIHITQWLQECFILFFCQ